MNIRNLNIYPDNNIIFRREVPLSISKPVPCMAGKSPKTNVSKVSTSDIRGVDPRFARQSNVCLE